MVMIRDLKIKIEYFGYVIDKTENAQISMWQERTRTKLRFDVNCLQKLIWTCQRQGIVIYYIS